MTAEMECAQNDRIAGEVGSLVKTMLRQAAEKHSTGEIAVRIIVRSGKAERADVTDVPVSIKP